MPVQIIEGKGPLAQADLDAVEKALGVQLPDDYRAFMLKHNGGRPQPKFCSIQWRKDQKAAVTGDEGYLLRLFSIYDNPHENLLEMNRGFDDWLPQGTIAIGRDPGSNLFLLRHTGPRKGEILYASMEIEFVTQKDNVGLVASSFSDLMEHKLY